MASHGDPYPKEHNLDLDIGDLSSLSYWAFLSFFLEPRDEGEQQDSYEPNSYLNTVNGWLKKKVGPLEERTFVHAEISGERIKLYYPPKDLVKKYRKLTEEENDAKIEQKIREDEEREEKRTITQADFEAEFDEEYFEEKEEEKEEEEIFDDWPHHTFRLQHSSPKILKEK